MTQRSKDGFAGIGLGSAVCGSSTQYVHQSSQCNGQEGSVRPAGALQSRRSMRTSLSLMLKYNPLDPFDTMSDPERVDADDEDALLASEIPLP